MSQVFISYLPFDRVGLVFIGLWVLCGVADLARLRAHYAGHIEAAHSFPEDVNPSGADHRRELRQL